MLGVAPLVAHFFVFYYGVLADITPPVALAAYAGASMAGADPFKTGNTAFRLGLGQGAGAVRLRLFAGDAHGHKGVHLAEFFETARRMVGIVFLSAAFAGYGLTPMRAWERWLIGVASLPIIAPDPVTTLVGLAMASPVMLSQLLKIRAEAVPRPA